MNPTEVKRSIMSRSIGSSAQGGLDPCALSDGEMLAYVRQSPALAFVSWWHSTRLAAFSEGFRLEVDTELPEKATPRAANRAKNKIENVAQRTLMEQRRQARLQHAVWSEFLLTQNVVVWWSSDLRDGNNRPTLHVCGMDQVRYFNALGIPSLTVKVPKVPAGMTPEEQDAVLGNLPERWAKAVKNGGDVVLKPDLGDHFRFLTMSSDGRSACVPHLRGAIRDINILELLARSDFNGAWTHKDVIRHTRIGHETRYGSEAGSKKNFASPKAIKDVKTVMGAKQDAFDFFSNYDTNLAYAFLDPKFFADSKYTATLSRLMLWAGAYCRLLVQPNPTGAHYSSARTEGRMHRALVGSFLEEILSDPSVGVDTDILPASVAYNPTTFMSNKELIEAVRFAKPEGLMSGRTAREYLDLIDSRESARLREEWRPDNIRNYRPTFETKQGLTNGSDKGGSSPGGQPGAGRPGKAEGAPPAE